MPTRRWFGSGYSRPVTRHPSKFTGEAPNNHGSTLLREPAKMYPVAILPSSPGRYVSDNRQRYGLCETWDLTPGRSGVEI